MKAHITVEGKLCIETESETEEFAWIKWHQANWVSEPNVERKHMGYFRETSVIARHLNVNNQSND